MTPLAEEPVKVDINLGGSASAAMRMVAGKVLADTKIISTSTGSWNVYCNFYWNLHVCVCVLRVFPFFFSICFRVSTYFYPHMFFNFFFSLFLFFKYFCCCDMTSQKWADRQTDRRTRLSTRFYIHLVWANLLQLYNVRPVYYMACSIARCHGGTAVPQHLLSPQKIPENM